MTLFLPVCILKFSTMKVDWFCKYKMLIKKKQNTFIQKSSSVFCPLRKIKMFPLRKKSEKTGKQFSIFQKHLVVGFVCKVVSVCLQSTWCKESNRPMFEFKLCHFTSVFTWGMSLYLSKSVFSSKRVVVRIKDDLNKSVPGTAWAFKIIIF